MSSPLLDQQFKKIAKDIYRGLAKTHPSVKAAGYNQFLQLFSQRVFAVPYEEAKATVLKSGEASNALLLEQVASLKKGYARSLTSSELASIKARDYSVKLVDGPTLSAALSVSTKEALATSHIVQLLQMLAYFQMDTRDDTLLRTFGFGKLLDRVYATLRRCGCRQGDIDALLRKAEPLAFNSEIRGMWEGRALTSVRAQHKAMIYQSQFCGRTYTPDDYYSAMSLKGFFERAVDEQIPYATRGLIRSVLVSLNYRKGGKGEFNERQNPATLEGFDYIAMEPVLYYRKLHDALLSLV